MSGHFTPKRLIVLVILSMASQLLFTHTAIGKELLREGEGMDMHLFRPAVDTKGHFTTDGTDVLPHKSFSLGMTLDFGFNHFIAVEMAEDAYAETKMDKAIRAIFFANIGLKNRFVLGVQIPMGITSGVGYNPTGDEDDENANEWSTIGAFGDLAIHAKAVLLRVNRYPIGLGAVVQYQFGSGPSELLMGEPGNAGAISGKIVVDTAPASWYRLALNVGARYPFGVVKDNHLHDGFDEGSEELLFHYGPTVNFGLGQSFAIYPDVFDIVLEAYGNQLADHFGDSKYLSMEGALGFKLYVDGRSHLMAGAAAGIPIAGTPEKYGFQNAQWRVFLGFAFEPSIDDRDRDGIPDDEDQCPDDPEDWDDFNDSDGCPDLDNDQDGILDREDSCPNTPEDKDGDRDEDGCPEEEKVPEDSDGDGIPDEDDECPDDPEDKDGYEDEDGCPDPDNDGDLLPDVRDQCPLEREVLNGFEDEDGCPDEGEALVTITNDQFQLLKGIRFKTASDVIIGDESFQILDAVVTVLTANPQIKVRVEGHTDSRGTRRYNIRLSNRRARSVKRYLVQNGIDPSRLKAKGYGPDQPVDTNDTDAGRAANRRVVFAIIQK